MRRGERTNLENELKNLNADIVWKCDQQETVRASLLENIERTKKSYRVRLNVFHLWMKEIVIVSLFTVLITGFTTSVIFDHKSFENTSHNMKDQHAVVVNTGGEDGDDYKISELAQRQLHKLDSLNFDLKWPEKTSIPVRGLEVAEVFHKEVNGANIVWTTFKQGDDEIFKIEQHEINDSVKKTVESSLNFKREEKGTKTLTINGKKAYYTNDPESYRSMELYINTEEYGFGIFSANLSKEQIINIASSIVN